MKKIILISLPNPVVVTAGYHLGPTYMPLQLGYLKAMAQECGLGRAVDIEILNCYDSYHANDTRLVELLAGKRPDMIGFTLYDSTVTRSLHIARALKRRLPRLFVLAGGPEVTPDHAWLINDPAIDIGCFGEGEEAFVDILRTWLSSERQFSAVSGIYYRSGRTSRLTAARPPLTDLGRLPSPLLNGIFSVQDYTSHYVMASRGCRSRCSYCVQGAEAWSPFPITRVEDEVRALARGGARYITFFDSNFVPGAYYRGLLKGLAALNGDKRLSFSCFVYADLIDAAFADLLQRCNVVDVQLGLQSMHPPTLQAIGRTVNIDRFLRGVSLLRARGIAVQHADLIFGLPYETKESFDAGASFLRAHGIAPKPYRLHLFPGTRMRAEAAQHGIVARARPPYFVMRSGCVSAREMQEIDRLDAFPAHTRHVRFSDYARFEFPARRSRPGCVIRASRRPLPAVHALVLHLDAARQTLRHTALLARRIGRASCQQLTVWLRMNDMRTDTRLARDVLRRLRAANPFQTMTVIIEPVGRVDARLLRAVIAEAAGEHPRGAGHAMACALIPWYTAQKKPGLLSALRGLAPCAVAVDIHPRTPWRDTLLSIAGRTDIAEIVIDYAEDCTLDFIVSALPDIRDIALSSGVAVSFRNLALNYAGIVPVDHAKRFIEPVMSMDVDMVMRSRVRMDASLHVDIVAFQRRVQERSGLVEGAILPPLAYVEKA